MFQSVGSGMTCRWVSAERLESASMSRTASCTQVRFGETNMSAMSSLPHSGESRPIGDTDRGSEQTPELRKYTRAIHMSFDVSSDPPPP